MNRLDVNKYAAKILGFVNCTTDVNFDNPEMSVFQADPTDSIAFDEINIWLNDTQLIDAYDICIDKEGYFTASGIIKNGIRKSMIKFVNDCAVKDL